MTRATAARPVMTAEQWRASVLAGRPPLSQAQISVLRAIFRPDMKNAAPARLRGPHHASSTPPDKEQHQ